MNETICLFLTYGYENQALKSFENNTSFETSTKL